MKPAVDMEKTAAFLFNSALARDQVRERLATLPGRKWIERESHWHGEYLLSVEHPDGDYARVRFFLQPDGGGYAVDFKLRSERADADAEKSWQALSTLVEGQLLPLVDAENVRPTTDFD